MVEDELPKVEVQQPPIAPQQDAVPTKREQSERRTSSPPPPPPHKTRRVMIVGHGSQVEGETQRSE